MSPRAKANVWTNRQLLPGWWDIVKTPDNYRFVSAQKSAPDIKPLISNVPCTFANCSLYSYSSRCSFCTPSTLELPFYVSRLRLILLNKSTFKTILALCTSAITMSLVVYVYAVQFITLNCELSKMPWWNILGRKSAVFALRREGNTYINEKRRLRCRNLKKKKILDRNSRLESG